LDNSAEGTKILCVVTPVGQLFFDVNPAAKGGLVKGLVHIIELLSEVQKCVQKPQNVDISGFIVPNILKEHRRVLKFGYPVSVRILGPDQMVLRHQSMGEFGETSYDGF
jgi:hypothetical protein